MACTSGSITQTPAPINIEYEVFNNTGSTTYDVSLYAGVLNVGNVAIPWTNLGKGANSPSIQQTAVAVAQVITLTPLALACGCGSDADDNIVYGVTLQWVDGCKRQWTIPYTATVCCTGLTPTIISAALQTAINGDPNAIVTASGTTTLILTAKTAGQDFLAVVQSTGSNPQFNTPVITTANVYEFGNPADFVAKYNIPASAFVSSATYILVKLPYWVATPDTANPKGSGVVAVRNNTLYVFVQSGAQAETNVLSGGGKLCAILAGNDTVNHYLGVMETACS